MLLLLALQLLCPPQANPVKVEILNPNIAVGLAYSARKAGIPRAKDDFIVEGEVRLTVPVLSVKTITFKRGSRLILASTLNGAQQFQSFSPFQFYLIADDIEVEDPQDPGTVTWDPGPISSPARSWIEPASPGLSGAEGGGSGAPGRAGSAGAPGAPGRSGPSIMLIAQQIGGLPIFVLCGQQGGRGGLGQPGGDGGRGGLGESASQNAFNCSHGAGSGGPGGNGGEGGPGGIGGQGGDSGSLVLLTQNQRFDSNVVKAYVNAGSGGEGGDGGPGGALGIGGPGGPEQMPWCRGAGGKGPDGTRGRDGSRGTLGKDGKPGSASVGFIDSKQLHSITKGDF